MCRSLLVVESGLEGGTAITASLAVSYGRDIFAVPGPPYTRPSALPNELIAQGAAPVRSAEDIRTYYGERTPFILQEEENQPQMDFFQQLIYELLTREDMSVEDIETAVQGAPGEVGAALTMMELCGLCRRLPGGRYGV
jgi:DNA processing protein